MDLKQKYGHLALVAGASEGLGAAFSSYLASHKIDLVLIARRKEKLDNLAQSLKKNYQVNVTCIYCDLADANALQIIKESVNGMEIGLMVYNAALSYIGPFEKNSMAHHHQMARVNMMVPLNLLQFFGAPMLDKGKGAFIIMASMAGFQGSGFLAAYAATKAFNRVLAESLWYEWKSRGVDIMACSAGATATPNFIRSNPEKPGFFTPRVQSPNEVVKACFRQLGKKPSFIPGWGNMLASFIMQKVLPRKMAIKIMGDNTRKMYRI